VLSRPVELARQLSRSPKSGECRILGELRPFARQAVTFLQFYLQALVPGYNRNTTSLHVQKSCNAFFLVVELKSNPQYLQVKRLLANPQEWEMIMKTFMTVFLLLVSTSLLADRPTECNPNANYHACDNFQARNAVPEPGSLALIGLGIAGLIAARRRKR